MRHLIRGLSLFAALAFAAPALAQDEAEGAQPSEIVVTGNRNMERQVRDFVGALAEAPVRGQLSRFDWEVCPSAVGFPPAQKQALVRRMRRVAEAAGIRVASPSCRPNVMLVVTNDKRAFIEGLVRENRGYFSGLDLVDIRRLARAPGPAAAWQLEGRLNADGVELPGDAVTGQQVNLSANSASRITAFARPHFTGAVVVVETKALTGLSLTQLADYASMRAFARTDPSRLAASTAPTILKILDAPMGSEIPLTLTSWDLGFLRALYGSGENLYAGAQRAEMRRLLKDEVAPSEAPQD